MLRPTVSGRWDLVVVLVSATLVYEEAKNGLIDCSGFLIAFAADKKDALKLG